MMSRLYLHYESKATSLDYQSANSESVVANQVTSVASESAFSTTGRVLDPFRSSLTPNIMKALVCTQDWLRYSKQERGSVEEQLEELEEIEIFVS
ncbi:unnamed protein product [Prunus armeniaca]